MAYPFRRDFFELLVNSIQTNSVVFLLGTRKCGKTVGLHQIEETTRNAKYIDFKTIPNAYEQMEVFRTILDSIHRNDEMVYLLDEITYVENAEAKICEIANALTEVVNTNTKIVFTGSQSVALNAWADRAFAGNADKISVDFLTYSEFLRYKNLTECNPETYTRFLYEAADFYNFKSLKDYLQGCIEETIISNAKAANCIFDNDCTLIRDNVELLINICYQTLFTLHNNVTAGTFFKNDKVKDTILGTFHDTCRRLGDATIADKIENSFIGSYSNIKSQDLDTLKQAFIFLKQCGLISITPIARELDSVPNVYRSMRLNKSDIDCKKDLFEKFNITINYPMFYVQILKDILQDDMPTHIPGTLLGSIVECHARGLLPDGFEYKTFTESNGIETEREIDYVNLTNNLAIEFTISSSHKMCFELLPDHMQKICLTKQENSVRDGVAFIAYCKFLHDLSQARYLGNTSVIHLPVKLQSIGNNTPVTPDENKPQPDHHHHISR